MLFLAVQSVVLSCVSQMCMVKKYTDSKLGVNELSFVSSGNQKLRMQTGHGYWLLSYSYSSYSSIAIYKSLNHRHIFHSPESTMYFCIDI